MIGIIEYELGTSGGKWTTLGIDNYVMDCSKSHIKSRDRECDQILSLIGLSIFCFQLVRYISSKHLHLRTDTLNMSEGNRKVSL